MTERRETRAGKPARPLLTRERIVQIGLQFIDQQGMESLTMRKLASKLEVDPMSLYRHFKNKEALLDNIAEKLWDEVAFPESERDWEALLRSVATSLYGLAHAHPHAYALLLNRQTLPLTMLRLSDALRERLQQAGFERQRAGEVICALFSYAIGYAMVELSTLSPQPGEPTREEAMTDVGRLAQLMRRLPNETPTHTIEVAYEMTNYDLDAQFAFGLHLMLTGLRSREG